MENYEKVTLKLSDDKSRLTLCNALTREKRKNESIKVSKSMMDREQTP